MAVAAKIFGSCTRTHSSFGAVNPGIARLPVIRVISGTACFEFERIARALRPSFHKMAGRRARWCLSSSVAPCI